MNNPKQYFIELAYKGTQFNGWQSQPQGKTVQQELERALSLKLRSETQVVGCGRTDSGVHAHFFIAHFQSEVVFDKNDLVFNLNAVLPSGIAISKIYSSNYHARFDATSRSYRYFINFLKDPFSTDNSWYLYNTKLNLEAMQCCAKHLLNVSDFSAFEKIGSDNKTSICKVTKAEWHKTEKGIYFEITADRFLRNMVRAIVGTLVEVGKEKLSEKDFLQIIEQKDRGKAGASAPAKGLFLWNIEYPKK